MGGRDTFDKPTVVIIGREGTSKREGGTDKFEKPNCNNDWERGRDKFDEPTAPFSNGWGINHC